MKNVERHLMAKISWYRQSVMELEELIKIEPSEENYFLLAQTKDYLIMSEEDMEEIV